MATQRAEVSMELLDKLGVPASFHTFLTVDDSKTIAVALGELATFALNTDAITDAVIQKYSLSIVVPGGTPLKTEAGENPVEETGLVNFSQTGQTWKYGIDVPAISSLMITNGKIDLSNAAIVTWVTWLTTAHTALTAVSKFFLTLVALLDALISFRKHRRAENRRSFEV